MKQRELWPWRGWSGLARWVGTLAVVACGALPLATETAQAAPSFNVMAPLDMRLNEQEREKFRRQLAIAKGMGVNAVAVDVWWGAVEGAGDNQWDWSYYDGLFKEIVDAGLHIVPVMSFHRCGGNVGDTCFVPVPDWIWTQYADEAPGRSKHDLMYRSEQDNDNGESVSLWKDDWAVPQYIEFMNAFEEHYADKKTLIDEISISGGPAGELRYPSYNAHDQGSGYPNRGFFQSYSGPARKDFRAWVLDKYKDLPGVNRAWGISLDSADRIGPPDDGTPADGRASDFVGRSDHAKIQYGKDFIDWYNGSLAEHGQRMLDAAIQAFDGAFKGVSLGIKLPGVHWRMKDPHHPRIAELTAGLIQSSIDFEADATAHGYQNILEMIGRYHNQRSVVLHFTALEMDNCDETLPPSCQENFSMAKALVFWIAQGADDRHVVVKGENALSGGVESDHGWDNIENAFKYAKYGGLTVLRIENVTYNGTGQWRYRNFITNSTK